MRLKLKDRSLALVQLAYRAVAQVGAAFVRALDDILLLCGGLAVAIGFGMLFPPVGVIVLGVEMTVVGALLARDRASRGSG